MYILSAYNFIVQYIDFDYLLNNSQYVYSSKIIFSDTRVMWSLNY